MSSSSMPKIEDVSVGFYSALNYQVLAEFGSPRIAPITLAEQLVKALVEIFQIDVQPCAGVNTTFVKKVYSVYGPLKPTVL
jgi:hypothetical protein